MLNRLFLMPSLITLHSVIWDSPNYYKVKRYDEISGGVAQSLERLQRLSDIIL